MFGIEKSYHSMKVEARCLQRMKEKACRLIDDEVGQDNWNQSSEHSATLSGQRQIQSRGAAQVRTLAADTLLQLR